MLRSLAGHGKLSVGPRAVCAQQLEFIVRCQETITSHYPEVLTPQNSQIIFIDQQPQMAFGVQSIDRQTLKNNVVGLAKAAKVFDIPVTITTVENRQLPAQPIRSAGGVPEQKILERTSMNSWDDQNVRDSLARRGPQEGRGRRAVDRGLHHHLRPLRHARGRLRDLMVADVWRYLQRRPQSTPWTAWSRPAWYQVTWQQVLLEWQRDWARRDTYDAVMAIAMSIPGSTAWAWTTPTPWCTRRPSGYPWRTHRPESGQ